MRRNKYHCKACNGTMKYVNDEEWKDQWGPKTDVQVLQCKNCGNKKLTYE